MNPHVRFDSRLRVHVVESARVSVPVANLWRWKSRGVTVSTLMKRYPSLRPSQILDALSWAHDDVERVEREIGALDAGMAG